MIGQGHDVKLSQHIDLTHSILVPQNGVGMWLAVMDENGDLAGSTEDRGNGNVFGSWQSADKHVLVIADRVDGTVEIEFNFLLGDAPKS